MFRVLKMVLVQDFIFQVYDLGKNLSFELYEFKSLIIKTSLAVDKYENEKGLGQVI